MAISGSDNQEATRITSENARIAAEVIRVLNEQDRITSGALIKSGGSMTGDLNLLNENSIKFNDKYEIKYNSALNVMEILAL